MKAKVKQQLHELSIYFALWLFVFFVPVLGLYLNANNDRFVTFDWSTVIAMWCGILPFFILFLLHNFLLAPRLLLSRKPVLYTASVAVVLFLFYLFQWHAHLAKKEPPPVSMERRYPMPLQEESGREARFPEPPSRMYDKPAEFRMHPRFFGSVELVRLVMALLMLGFNVAVKLLFKSQRDEKMLRELERSNLQQELEYLKYQVIPHFLMNTLNNIHALVDIDAEKAKITILKLSKMMRYVLYEGSNRTVLLRREIEFLVNYIALMRLRYTDKVKIETDFPAEAPDVLIPPMLFISFVENAFKHGVSYQTASFVRMAVKIENRNLSFRCVNSKCNKNIDPYSGLGLENARKRLNLLYGNAYALRMEDGADMFDILLVIPLAS